MPHALDNGTLQVRIAYPEDWDIFLDWCTAEGWIVSETERSVTSAQFTALLQPGSHSWHIGPWIERDPCTNISAADIEHFITLIRKNAPGGQALSVDLLKASTVGAYLVQAGFHKVGSSVLMCRSRKHIDLGRVCALASLGSIG